MARPRKTMKTHREILRHALELELSGNQTQLILGVSRGTVQDCIKRARAANLSWQQVETLSDDDLFTPLFPEKRARQKEDEVNRIDWQKVFTELKRRGVELSLLYEEQVESQGLNLSYSQYCRRFKQWAESKDISMRQQHAAGENLFIDFGGMTVPVTDPETGEVCPAQIFVATFGVSNYT